MDVALVLVEKRSPKPFEASWSKNVGPPPLTPTMYRTRGENINHYTTDAVCCCVGGGASQEI
jgi:hypothetical protein